jgi:hypothetical protein
VTVAEEQATHEVAVEAAIERPSRDWLIVVGLVALLSLPLVVAAVALHHTRWYPLLDWAQTEIRIRDITGGHPPLIGLAGRIGPFGADGGSHPGPISFYLLWPAWELFGGRAYGMYVGNVALDVAAISLAMWIAYRRGGVRVAIAIALVLMVLMRAYGAFMLTLPWNPYLPVLWWFVVILCVWSLLCGDLVMLPVAIVAGSFCTQTHISYLGLVGGLGLLALGAVIWRRVRSRDRRWNRDLWLYGLIAAAILIVLWIPPVIDELVNKPANLSTIRDYFSSPPDPPIGFREGINVLLSQLNPARLFGQTLIRDGSHASAGGARWPGMLLIGAWIASFVAAARMRMQRLIRLDVVLAVALAFGVVSAARIFGIVWFYLLLWAFALAAFMLFAIGWTVAEAVRRRTDTAEVPRLARAGTAVMLAAIVVVCAVFTVSAAQVDVMSPKLNAQLAAVTPPTVEALTRLRAEGQRGPFFVTWLPEPQDIGAEGYGLLNELLRNGYDVQADIVFRPGATRYHVTADHSKFVMQIHLATGADIARWRNDPRFQQVTAYDGRSAAERAEFDRLHAQTVAAMEREGLSAEVHELDDNTFILQLDPAVSPSTRKLISRMLDIGMPVAVFFGPLGDPR